MLILFCKFLLLFYLPILSFMYLTQTQAAQISEPDRTYYSIPLSKIDNKDPLSVKHTHICVEGKVDLIREEEDGDIHIRIAEGNKFIVLEQIPTLTGVKGKLPKKGDIVTACGISRYDTKHFWHEIHPVESYGGPP